MKWTGCVSPLPSWQLSPSSWPLLQVAVISTFLRPAQLKGWRMLKRVGLDHLFLLYSCFLLQVNVACTTSALQTNKRFKGKGESSEVVKTSHENWDDDTAVCWKPHGRVSVQAWDSKGTSPWWRGSVGIIPQAKKEQGDLNSISTHRGSLTHRYIKRILITFSENFSFNETSSCEGEPEKVSWIKDVRIIKEKIEDELQEVNKS